MAKRSVKKLKSLLPFIKGGLNGPLENYVEVCDGKFYNNLRIVKDDELTKLVVCNTQYFFEEGTTNEFILSNLDKCVFINVRNAKNFAYYVIYNYNTMEFELNIVDPNSLPDSFRIRWLKNGYKDPIVELAHLASCSSFVPIVVDNPVDAISIIKDLRKNKHRKTTPFMLEFPYYIWDLFKNYKVDCDIDIFKMIEDNRIESESPMNYTVSVSLTFNDNKAEITMLDMNQLVYLNEAVIWEGADPNQNTEDVINELCYDGYFKRILTDTAKKAIIKTVDPDYRVQAREVSKKNLDIDTIMLIYDLDNRTYRYISIVQYLHNAFKTSGFSHDDHIFFLDRLTNDVYRLYDDKLTLDLDNGDAPYELSYDLGYLRTWMATRTINLNWFIGVNNTDNSKESTIMARKKTTNTNEVVETKVANVEIPTCDNATDMKVNDSIKIVEDEVNSYSEMLFDFAKTINISTDALESRILNGHDISLEDILDLYQNNTPVSKDDLISAFIRYTFNTLDAYLIENMEVYSNTMNIDLIDKVIKIASREKDVITAKKSYIKSVFNKYFKITIKDLIYDIAGELVTSNVPAIKINNFYILLLNPIGIDCYYGVLPIISVENAIKENKPISTDTMMRFVPVFEENADAEAILNNLIKEIFTVCAVGINRLDS